MIRVKSRGRVMGGVRGWHLNVWVSQGSVV